MFLLIYIYFIQFKDRKSRAKFVPKKVSQGQTFFLVEVHYKSRNLLTKSKKGPSMTSEVKVNYENCVFIMLAFIQIYILIKIGS